MNNLPVVVARIHPPLLRADTLSRERLNTWLNRAAKGRVVMVVAAAGFGKTTLLADWARNAVRLTAWYRLEPDDRDWLTFTRHLVASGRELDPGFAAETYSLLMQLGPGGPTQAEILSVLVREFAEFGAAHPEGLTLIFDDFQAVDGSDDVTPTVRALIDHTGPGFSIVIGSRSTPDWPLGRLRAHGTVSRLGGDALCFNLEETQQLFADAYRLPLDRDVVEQLVARTKGWAALLNLVRASAEGRSPEVIRELVAALTGAAGTLHDLLAEEVLDHLPSEIANFLVKASLLDDLDPAAAMVLTNSGREEVTFWLAAAEDLALINRPDPTAHHRFVPLVREFLSARLAATASSESVREMHLGLAQAFDGADWRISATHYQRAGDFTKAREVVGGALDMILGTGQYRAADDLLAGAGGDDMVRAVLRSRVLLQMGATPEAIAQSSAALRHAEQSARGHLALAAQNAASIAIGARRYEEALRYAQQAIEAAGNDEAREVATAYGALVGASTDGNLPMIARQLQRMLAAQGQREQSHYAAITSLNLAQLAVWLDQADEALRMASDSARFLKQSSQGYEDVSVRLAQAQAHAYLGNWPAAEERIRLALETQHPEGEEEAVLEAASLAAWFGPDDLAAQILSHVRREALPAAWSIHWRVLDLWLAQRADETAAILAELNVEPPPSGEVAASFRWHLARARAALHLQDHVLFERCMTSVEEVTSAQRSPVQRRLSGLLRAIRRGPDTVSQHLATWLPSSDPLLGVFAGEITKLLPDLSEQATSVVSRAASGSPQRWRGPMRQAVSGWGERGAERAASILEQIGEREDVALLREVSRHGKRSGKAWGDLLLRRLAPALWVDDLGSMSLSIGGRVLEGHGVRRKVLALLAFLASQPGGSATPDQVVEALWPDLDPEQALNSVHQTIYFLRRVIEHDYRAGRSAEYLHFDGDIMVLDRTLVDCRSWRCRRLLSQRPETQRLVEDLLENYVGRFAADFAYEDWAAAYRDSLHAAFLALVERAVEGRVGSSDLRWRLWVGQRTLVIDPEADAIEVQVIRLYRALGAPTAAAEQYAHYASVLRDQLGVEPPPFSDL